MTDITYVIPISGVDFVRYVAFFTTLSKTSLRPKRMVSASGGCMISYLAMMSSFTDTIENWNISGKLFAYKPIPLVPRMISFLFTGSLYRRPNIDEYITKLFVPSKLKDVEIITGYYSNTLGKIVLSSNFHPEMSELNSSNFDVTNVATEHCNGDLMHILRSIEATTNIPYLLPPLGNKASIDYGVHSPSPLTFMKHCTNKLKQVIYFAPINIEKTHSKDFTVLLFINDIHTEITRLSAGYNHFTDYRDMSFVPSLISLESFLLVVYTTVDVNLSVVNFDSFQAKTMIETIKRDVRFRLYRSN
jgi:predicted acylesterase/phospholipase RssA